MLPTLIVRTLRALTSQARVLRLRYMAVDELLEFARNYCKEHVKASI